MTPKEATDRIINAIRSPRRKDRWSLRLWKKWRRQFKAYSQPKGFRIPEYEDILAQDFNSCFWYAVHIVRGQLPKKMHNMMLSYGISNPDDESVKFYFSMIENKP
jgi:hypothetical protein